MAYTTEMHSPWLEAEVPYQVPPGRVLVKAPFLLSAGRHLLAVFSHGQKGAGQHPGLFLQVTNSPPKALSPDAVTWG